jgi:hypothetical protein
MAESAEGWLTRWNLLRYEAEISRLAEPAATAAVAIRGKARRGSGYWGRSQRLTNEIPTKTRTGERLPVRATCQV